MTSPLTRRPFLSLEPELRCPNRRAPRCGRKFFRGAGDTAMYECEKCGAHWWAKWLQAGPVRPQIEEMYDGDHDLVGDIMSIFELPETLQVPMFWQIPIPTNAGHYHRFRSRHELSFRVRTQHFLRQVVALFRKAS